MAICNNSTPPNPRLRILVAEDDSDAAEVLCDTLRLAGYEVRFGKTGLVALSLAREWVPDVAIIDLEMPGMRGHDLARRLRAAHSERIIFVALTEYGDVGHRERAAAAGFVLYLVKPVPFDQLNSDLSLFMRKKVKCPAP